MTTQSRCGMALMILALSGVAIAQDEPPTPRVMALLRVRPESPDATDAAIARDQQTQLALIKSQELIRQALKNPDPAALLKDQSDPVEYVRRRLHAEFEGEILKVWMTAASPENQATFVNAIVETYAASVQNESLHRLDQLQKAEHVRFEQLRSRRDTLKSLNMNSGAGQAEQFERARQFMLAQIDECERQDLALRLKETETQIRLKAAEETRDMREAVTALGVELSVIEAQRSLLGEEIRKLSKIPERLTQESDSVAQLRSEIESLQHQWEQAHAARQRAETHLGDRIQVFQRATASASLQP